MTALDHLTTLKDQLNLTLIEAPSELVEMAEALGYQPTEEVQGVRTEFGDGLLVYALQREFNDGLYILYKTEDGRYELMVLVANTISKAPLVQKLIHDLDNYVHGQDLHELDAFNLVEVFAFFTANSFVKPIAKGLYPDDPLKQDQFVHIYYPRFLANVARYYMGDSTLDQEAVVSEPFLVRHILDSPEVDSPFTQTDNQEVAYDQTEDTVD